MKSTPTTTFTRRSLGDPIVSCCVCACSCAWTSPRHQATRPLAERGGRSPPVGGRSPLERGVEDDDRRRLPEEAAHRAGEHDKTPAQAGRLKLDGQRWRRLRLCILRHRKRTWQLTQTRRSARGVLKGAQAGSLKDFLHLVRSDMVIGVPYGWVACSMVLKTRSVGHARCSKFLPHEPPSQAKRAPRCASVLQRWRAQTSSASTLRRKYARPPSSAALLAGAHRHRTADRGAQA